MKKPILTVIILILIMAIIVCLIINRINKKEKLNREIERYNLEYELYTKKQVRGTDLATLIGMAVKENEKNHIQKNEQGYYIPDGKDSIKIDIYMATTEKTYPMEEIYNNEITDFVKNFNTVMFSCSDIKYHQETGKIAKMVFDEQI